VPILEEITANLGVRISPHKTPIEKRSGVAHDGLASVNNEGAKRNEYGTEPRNTTRIQSVPQ